jgi:serine beta-lactamase-like protein LACTB
MTVFHTRLAITLVAVAVLLAAPVASKPTGSLTKAQTDSIDVAVGAAMAERHIPGLSLAVVKDGEIICLKSYGFANLETKEPATNATVYRIASSTKPITATAAMQLVEAGKLDLDAPVQKYVPEFPEKKFPITTRQLLTHTSGVRNYRRGEPERTDHFDRLIDTFFIFKDDSLEFEPGTKYAYSTFGYVLLGVVIERASGTSFPDYMRDHIFKPAGMKITQPDDARVNIPNRAQGYTPKTYAVFNGDYKHGRPMDSSYKLPAGGFVSTAEDMARFAIAVMDGVLIKPETLAMMAVEQKTKDGAPTGYSFGWYAGNKRNPPESIWHGGVQSGFTADLWLVRKERFAVVILTNLEGGGALGLEKLSSKVGDVVLK